MEDIIQAVKWIAFVATAIVVLLIAGAFYAGRASARLDALSVKSDSIRTVLVAKIDTVTIYVAQADSSKRKSDASKAASDSAVAKIVVVDPTTIALRLTPTSAPSFHSIPAEMIAAHLRQQITIDDQAKTILDTRAALSHAQGALKTAVDLNRVDSTRIVQLQQSQCDRRCKAVLLGLGALIGAIATK